MASEAHWDVPVIKGYTNTNDLKGRGNKAGINVFLMLSITRFMERYDVWVVESTYFYHILGYREGKRAINKQNEDK